PLVEEGWLEGTVPELAVRKYLEPLASLGVGVVVLGCTHYPLLKPLIAEQALQLSRDPIVIVDSAEATANHVAALLRDKGLARVGPSGTLSLLVTDLPDSFRQSAERFLGEDVEGAEQVDIAPSDGC